MSTLIIILIGGQHKMAPWEKGLEDLTPEELEQALINLDQVLTDKEE